MFAVNYRELFFSSTVRKTMNKLVTTYSINGSKPCTVCDECARIRFMGLSKYIKIIQQAHEGV